MSYTADREAENAARIEWFNALRPGDKVLYDSGGRFLGSKHIVAVKNRTPTGKVRLENGELFDDSCYKYQRSGGGWGSSLRIEPITEKFLREQEHGRLAWYLEEIKYKELPLEFLRELQAIHNRPKDLEELEFETDEAVIEGEVVTYRDNKETKRALIYKILAISSGEHPYGFKVKVLGEVVK